MWVGFSHPHCCRSRGIRGAVIDEDDMHSLESGLTAQAVERARYCSRRIIGGNDDVDVAVAHGNGSEAIAYGECEKSGRIILAPAPFTLYCDAQGGVDEIFETSAEVEAETVVAV